MASVNRSASKSKKKVHAPARRVTSKTVKTRTHGGAITAKITDAEELLRRSVMSCMLWENTFYEGKNSVADRIMEYIPHVSAERCAEIAIEARNQMKLRHAPLLIVRRMAELDTHKHLVAKTLFEVIQRPDELTEFLSIYWKKAKDKLSAQVKKGLARAISKFNEFALAKWNQDSDVKLRDVLFLTHAKPLTGVSGYTKDVRKKKGHRVPKDEGSQLFDKLVKGKMDTPDTWEVELSKSKDKKASWTRLITEHKLGDMAVLMNLRNMEQAGVSSEKIRAALKGIKGDRVLPFRFIAAAHHAVKYESEIEAAMMRSLEGKGKLRGKTIFIVDISGSMRGQKISEKSEMDRLDAACALAAVAREICQEAVIYATAGDDGASKHATGIVPARKGFALAEAIKKMGDTLGGGGIFLHQVIDYIRKHEENADRIIVITDEQDCDKRSERSPDKATPFGKHNYILNVGTYDKGIAYNEKWTHISGWSESIIDYIKVYEEGEDKNQQGNNRAKVRA